MATLETKMVSANTKELFNWYTNIFNNEISLTPPCEAIETFDSVHNAVKYMIQGFEHLTSLNMILRYSKKRKQAILVSQDPRLVLDFKLNKKPKDSIYDSKVVIDGVEVVIH